MSETTKLNKVNSILTACKPEAEKKISEIYKIVQKEPVFEGRVRTYQPLDQNGQTLPAENQKVQYRVEDMIRQAVRVWTEIWGLTYTQDSGNQDAVADIVVDGEVVMAQVPVTTLLYLEKQVNDLCTFIDKLPTPALADNWTYDSNQRLLRGEPTTSQRTSKEPTVIVKYDATKEHPAQTELFTKDVPVGTWTQVAYSGALPAEKKQAYLAKAKKLLVAVKEAREEANMQQVERKSVDPLFRFVFGSDAS